MTDSTPGAKTNVIAGLGARCAGASCRERGCPGVEPTEGAMRVARPGSPRQAWLAPNEARARNSRLPPRRHWPPPGQTQPGTVKLIAS